MELSRKLRSAFLAAACVYLVTVTATFSMAADKSPASGQKVNITGPIVVREGDMGQVLGHFALDTAERAVSSLAQEFLLPRLTPKAKSSN
jgi:hypothetical protein